MSQDLIWTILEVIFIGLTAGVAVGVFFRSKGVAIHDRISKVEDKVQDLSAACIRREELHNANELIRSDVRDLTRRIDAFINGKRKA